jgi:ribosomal protein S12 methylthiotransferase
MSGASVALVHLGCDKNTVDGQRLLGELARGGWEVVAAGEVEAGRRDVELLLVNTCSFIRAAREQSIETIAAALELKRRGRARRVGVAGCYARDLMKTLDHASRSAIDLFLGPGDIPEAVAIASGRAAPAFAPAHRSNLPGPRHLDAAAPPVAFVKIAEGCNRRCAFCTIPALRGRYVSRPANAILAEIKKIVAGGAKEIVLVSQDTSSWGRETGEHLPELVRRIGRRAERGPFFRLRLHYLHPARVNKALIEAIASTPSAAPYFDIPIQHASPTVLKAMRRESDVARIERTMAAIRGRFEESAIRTTVITGHPGETPREFDRLLRFIETHPFDRLGVIPFSPEPGTAAARLGRPRDAARRAGILMELQAGISRRLLAERIGREYDVLMEREGEGRSEFEAPEVDGVIRVKGWPGSFVRTRITSTGTHDLEGVAITEVCSCA